MRTRGAYTAQRGLTFVDVVVVMVIVSVMAAYGVMKMNSAGENTLAYQAQRLARDIRHVQVLSSTWGRPLQIATAGDTYTVSCVTAGLTPPCNASPVVDPVTGNAFTVSLQHGVSLAVSGVNPSAFDTQGRPLNGGAVSTTSTSYTLSAGTSSIVVAVAPITGYVSVTP